MKIKFSDRVIKKVAAAVMSLAMAVSMVGINAYAEKEAPVLYLEVSSTLTAQDTFAWTEYDHYNYYDRYTTSLAKHISYVGDNIKMTGYGSVPYKDFLLVEDNNEYKKILEFDIQRDNNNWHSMEGGGFLFNASVSNGKIRGFCILITSSGLRLSEITNADLTSFRNGTKGNVYNYGSVLCTASMTNLLAEHHMKIEVDKSTVSVWDGDKLLIDNYELPENDYGFGYGPITSHASHGCRQQSYFTFSNIKMETVTGYYIKLETVPDEWGYTEDYWKETFTLTNVEYTPSEDETIANFDEYPLFKNAKDMILVYPDGTYEIIPWKNGKADYANAKRYINVLDQDVDVGLVKLEVGERIIGAYAE